MDKEMKDEILRWFSGMREAADGVRDFALEQTPLVAKEFVAYWTIVHAVWAVILAVLAVACWKCVRYFWRLEKPDDSDVAGCIVTFGVAVASCVFAVYNALMVAKCQLAPRLVILEWAVENIKKLS